MMVEERGWKDDGGRMMVEGKDVLYTPSRNVGSNGSIQVSSQLFLRGSTIVLYHLRSKGVLHSEVWEYWYMYGQG